MSSSLETLAAKLAEDTLKAQKELGDDRIFVEVGNVLAASSQTLEEAFLTEVRVRMSEEKARAFLINKVKAARAAKAAAEN
ncbi:MULTISPECIES: hypothetical protein [unclassified Shimia]|uniref:hypothetical protein n=1 Tax=unclassified Shimia TaxID=2630038 RepID=UPI001AD9E099|nr:MULTISPECIES: hypothetical protein [unclassified Shimia]MBO9472113.1 hypothetical protein [Shimia sp. R10_1]MDA5555719.1 hypothetical protein [Shimia sp. MMG029]